MSEKKEFSFKIEDIYKLDQKMVYEALNSQPGGLSDSQVETIQAAIGKNVISEKRGKPIILIFLSNFTSLMAILLWIGGIVAIIAEMPELGIAVWLVNVINGVFSFWQEFRASKATEALKNMLPSYTRVIRNNQEQQLHAEELVPGDIILLQEGDKISADARLLDSSDFQVNQSTLTGESNPVRKTHEAVLTEGLSRPETPNLIFTGTSVSSGTAKAIVTSIGMNTEFGKIASLTQNMEEEQSPLQKELDILTRQVSFIAIGFGIFFLLAAVFFVKEPLGKSFIFALGMVVAFIPEGLLPTVTLSLAMAVQRMAKEHALVKRLSAVETLGCTSVICSDKTGTLTQNEMTVSDLWLSGQNLKVTGLGYEPKGQILWDNQPLNASNHEDLRALLTAASLCSNARLLPPTADNNRYTVLGDPTEACLGVAAKKAGIDPDQQAAVTPRLRELPFDSRRKRMTTIHQLDKPVDDSQMIAYVKGAPKEVLELCSSQLKNGQITPLSETQRDAIIEANDQYARKGLRVLAIAQRLINRNSNLPKSLSQYTPELVESNLTFIGLIAMADPPRPEVADAVALCHAAKIRIIMITGDYGLTAESIAKRIGIVKSEHPRVVSGSELEKMSDQELKTALKDEIIFARVAPEQKYRVVCNLQEMNEIVAVTGDGVNDSPALKKADIGIAMGISGTDVAKEAADMILTDDNFASIVTAIEEGRAVYSNIRKFILYILNSNMPEAAPSAAFLFSRGGIPLPLTVMQILAVDLGTDMMPALGLGTELPETGIMNQPPRSTNDKLLNKDLVIKAFLWYGLIESAVCMAAYFYVNYVNGWPLVPLASSGVTYRMATTMTLASIVFCQIGMVMNCRTVNYSVIKAGLFKNKRVVFGIVFEIVLLSAIIYTPILQEIFNTAPLGMKEWLFLICLPVPIVLVEELRKAVTRHLNKKAKVS
ncbi:MAG: cation-transporting P-type ATPase [Erysipelotrichaceae bacterium]|nr:cation-transporting P-type ATPase [Erysipelotrichaceae bacterium]